MPLGRASGLPRAVRVIMARRSSLSPLCVPLMA